MSLAEKVAYLWRRAWSADPDRQYLDDKAWVLGQVPPGMSDYGFRRQLPPPPGWIEAVSLLVIGLVGSIVGAVLLILNGTQEYPIVSAVSVALGFWGFFLGMHKYLGVGWHRDGRDKGGR
jgi:hypothetical protein